MIPKRIQLENFLSFGEPAVEFVFTDDEPLWALCGRNGVGKSAVFDAITYALYGEHRGGKIRAEQLIRHGANGFRIVFEFEFNGVDYRITRIRSGRTSQKVERRVDLEWVAVDGLNSQDELKAWVKKTIGLEYEAFTTCVLLRQGQADKLLSATRDDRINLLKGIIGFERFEAVSQRVHAASDGCNTTFKGLKQQAIALQPVALEELAAADDAVADAGRKRAEAHDALTIAIQCVEQARQWEALEARRKKLQQQIDDARSRAGDAAAIRAGKARLNDLAAAVPELQTLTALRGEISRLLPEIDKAKSESATAAADLEAAKTAAAGASQTEQSHKQQADQLERTAKTLGEELDRGGKFVQFADDAANLSAKLAAFPPDLPEQLLQAKASEEGAHLAKDRAASALHAASALLSQAKERRQLFADVKVGVACSRCGQLVDAAHAAKERDHLDKDVQAREQDVAQSQKNLETSGKALQDTHTRAARLQKDKENFDAIDTKLRQTLDTLKHLDVTSDPAQLRAHLGNLGLQMVETKAAAGRERDDQAKAAADFKGFENRRQTLDAQAKSLGAKLADLETNLAAARATHDAGLPRLAPDWQTRFEILDNDAIAELAAELQSLRASGVADRFELLRRDEAQQAEWLKQLDDISVDAAHIPMTARVLVHDAARALSSAKAAAEASDIFRDTAVKAHNALKLRAEQHKELSAQLRSAERAHDLHKKLDDLLGQNGLQRELVRDAETQIVDLANETLQNLSDNELSLEPDNDPAAKDDKAFAPLVRRAGDGQLTPLPFLSGSQKFRVAVSVAIAVGRFASGRAKPLEAVIIDEGFGSLDKDGLRAMAEELKRLQQSQSLKRVILVSHQEEFTDRFAVGYLLTHGENGTTAAPFRR